MTSLFVTLMFAGLPNQSPQLTMIRLTKAEVGAINLKVEGYIYSLNLVVSQVNQAHKWASLVHTFGTDLILGLCNSQTRGICIGKNNSILEPKRFERIQNK